MCFLKTLMVFFLAKPISIMLDFKGIQELEILFA